jgi:hypothetical protein
VIHAAEDEAKPVAVINLDLRAGASGSHAIAADKIDQDTLTGIQQQAVRLLPRRPGSGGRRRLVDVGRVLVIDDAASFAGHSAAYQHLLLTPTIGRLLCVTVGPLADPVAIDLPAALAAENATGTGMLWIGDLTGTGWHLGMTTTTRLAEAGTDPDGSATLGEILDALTDPDVFDAALAAITSMDGNVAAPAVLSAIRWPALDVLRLTEELSVSGGPPGPHEIASLAGPDARQLLIDLWSIGPAIAQCERLLSEAETAARRLPRVPGLGGRRAWRTATELGHACAALGPGGPLWVPARFPAGLAAQLKQAPQIRTLWHPGLVLGPLLVVAGAGGTAIAYAPGGLPPAALDSIAAACAAVAFGALAVLWWRRVTRHWLGIVRLDPVRTALGALPSGLATHGVLALEEAAAAWYRAQQRRLVTWWRRARCVMRERIVGEVAAALGLPVPADQPYKEPVTDAAATAGLIDPELADVPQAIETAMDDALVLLATSVLDEDFIQLTSPRQLPLLDGSARAARLIRYAPAGSRETLAAGGADGPDNAERMQSSDVIWTTTGQTIGVIRLIPARPGVLRATDATGTAGTLLQIEVSGGGDERAAEGLAAWLGAGNDPDRQVTLVEPRSGPVIVTMRSRAGCEPVVKEVMDWLRAAEEPTEATFTCIDGHTAMVTATDTRTATGAESDAIAARIAKQCTQPST